jgi:outer membrane lipoprotein LolB
MLGGLLLTPFLIASCAINAPATGSFGLKNEPASELAQRYAGRISLVFEEAAQGSPQSFSGAFELRGNAQAGQLDLLTPLGSIAAQLVWQNGQALLTQGGQTRSFASADELIGQATGTTISAQQLFDWLQGKSTATSSDDWQVDLSRHTDGRITARRSAPQAATLRIILDQP